MRTRTKTLGFSFLHLPTFLIMLAFLLSTSSLPAQDAKFVVAPSGAGRAEQRKTSNDPQSRLDPHGEMPEDS